jgi:chromosome segregation ATPase
LAQAKKIIKDANKEEDCTKCSDLETKMKQLDKSLSKEKKDLSITRSKLERSKKKILSLEQQVSHLRGEIETREAAANDGGMNESLQAEICALREKNQSLLLAMKENNFDNLKQLKAENFSLKKENERLLRIDHLSLFEEIEDIKIRYNEAVRQLNQLSQR